MVKSVSDPGSTIQTRDAMPFLDHLFKAGMSALEVLPRNNNKEIILSHLPKNSVIVLIFAYKKSTVGSFFNFEAVY